MSFLFGILAGIGLPLQTSINTRLRRRVGSPYNASLVSFVAALLFLCVLLLVTGQGLHIDFMRIAREPIWIWAGGVCGVVFLTGNILLLSKLGSVQTVILPVLGQIVMGLIIDNFGLFNSPQSRLDVLKISGALLVMVGVVVVSMSNKRSGVSEGSKAGGGKALVLWRIFGVVAGMLSATQIAVNGYLGKVVDSPVRASAVSFMVGILVLTAICMIMRVRNGGQYVKESQPLWTWFGGILGGVYILANVTLSGLLGTGMTVIVLLIGATSGGLIVDHFGLYGAERKAVTTRKIIGVLIMLAGAAVIKIL